MDFNSIKKAYLIGIKGAGMAGVAQILKRKKIQVTGSDTSEKFFTDEILNKEHIKYFEKFSPENIPKDADLVVYSTAYNEINNIELATAKKENMLVRSYPEIVGYLFREKMGIAVAGTHGKTTTTALLAETLRSAKLDPSALVGSNVTQWQGSALVGEGNYFVLEADEYQNKFQYYDPWGVILTSVDFDHPDFYPDFEKYKDAFRKFVGKIPRHGFLVACAEDADVLEIAGSAKGEIILYGFGEKNDLVISRIIQKTKEQGLKFEAAFQGENLGEFEIQLVGKHNILNAAAVIAICRKLKIDMDLVRKGLRNFQGTTRRFEIVGLRNGAVLIDDYAHHPEEVKTTLKTARELYKYKKIWAVFHPHTYSRTKALLEEFAQSFEDADRVIVIDIYGSAREFQGGVSSMDLVDKINKYQPGKAQYIPTIEESIEALQNVIGLKDVIISMGAGDVWKVTHELKEE